ncbi:DUF4345 domain-containing protein [Agriterribacter sp.]|uniref:DUF4345 domain-containing protein n=1 Tax=Agriterribacter sp. TaxID=2821509 RepID=UPI002CA68C67|nr:DUF4345 domain-containing protein [Agriterribacter sp.]HRP57212.1 DUF4345 domain-containing protein [Agriterribacter sp.]
MLIANSILLGIVALICFLGGINIMLKGAMYFLPKDTPPQLVLDNLVRFLSGIYLGSGFLFAYASFNVENTGNLVYFLGLIVVFSGLGRLYSRVQAGTAGRYFDFIMAVEIALGSAIISIKWLSV